VAVRIPFVRLSRLAALLLVLGCRQEVPLPVVTPADAGTRADARVKPTWEYDAGSDVGADVAPPATASDAGECNGNVRQVSLWQFHPQVILAVDRSASMTEKAASATTSRWQILQDALKPLLRTYRQAIHFGYVEFPGPAAECRHDACCWGNFLQPSNSDAIEDKWTCGQMACPPRSADSPAAAALYKSRQWFDDYEQSLGSRHVLLFTDGEPSCSTAAAGKACEDANNEVAALHAQDRTTTVFALDPALSTNRCMTDMADLGSEAPLHVTGERESLVAQLETFLKPLSAEACTFRLRDALTPSQRLALSADGDPIRRDPTRTNGWEFDKPEDRSRLTVYGAWCDKLRASGLRVDTDAYVCTQ
jgi:hypothetical protein